MIRVKICGITRKEDAQYAIKAGASALGFIFYRKSQRYIPPVKVSNMLKDFPPLIDRIGVFVDMNIPGILSIVRRAGLSAVQLHGDETPEFCYELKLLTSIPIIKAFRVRDMNSIVRIEKYKFSINAILLDAFDPTQHGGTGKQFDWSLAAAAQQYNIPIIVSGGINSGNVEEVYKYLHPYALDISSGVEIAPGIKDHTKIKQFFEKLQQMQC